MPDTSTATGPLTRRTRAQAAIVAAQRRRSDERRPKEMTAWLAGYLISLAEGTMTDPEIAESVRGLAAGWQQIQAPAAPEPASVARRLAEVLRAEAAAARPRASS